jgi:hypothetical protein
MLEPSNSQKPQGGYTTKATKDTKVKSATEARKREEKDGRSEVRGQGSIFRIANFGLLIWKLEN